MMNYWGIRLGEGGKYVEEGHSKNFIGIGWEDMGELKWLLDYKEDHVAFSKLKELYKSTYGMQLSNNKVGIECGEIFRFVRDIEENDIVVVPNPSAKTVILGRVSSGYNWKDKWGDKCPYQSRRSVSWIKVVPRTELSVKLKNSLVWLTLVSLNSHSEEVTTLLSGEEQHSHKKTAQVTGQELAETVIERLKELDAKQFEEFVSNLLDIIGFESANRQHVGDGGIDIDGVLNTELGSISLKVQVKRVSGTIGNEKVLQLRGALGNDEHGVIVSTGSFSKPAIEEAEAEGKKQIKLVAKDDLVDIILNNYDDLLETYKTLLNIKKKEIPLTEKFIIET